MAFGGPGFDAKRPIMSNSGQAALNQTAASLIDSEMLVVVRMLIAPSLSQATIWCASAAAWDVAITGTAYATAALVARGALWPRIQRPITIVAYLATGLAITIAIEWWAVTTSRLGYTDAMPRIAGIGVSPLIQWTVIPLLVLGIIRKSHPES